jgi:uncharacterized membrane protein YphA (DoxX/SURF4 family)
MKKNVYIDTISFLFVLLFVYTATSKFLDFTLFKEQIAQSPILAPVAKGIAWLVPLSEVGISLMLLIPALRLKGLYLASGLMIAFTIYILLIMKFSAHLPCSCGGVISLLSWKDHLIFNSVFIVLGVIAIWLSKHNIVPIGQSHLQH